MNAFELLIAYEVDWYSKLPPDFDEPKLATPLTPPALTPALYAPTLWAPMSRLYNPTTRLSTTQIWVVLSLVVRLYSRDKTYNPGTLLVPPWAILDSLPCSGLASTVQLSQSITCRIIYIYSILLSLSDHLVSCPVPVTYRTVHYWELNQHPWIICFVETM